MTQRAFKLVTMMLVALLSTAGLTNSASAAECKNATLDEIKSLYKGKGEFEMVFFASWCLSCKPHLQTKHDSNVIFIAAFDEKPRAEKVLDAFGVKNPCFIGEEITDALGIRSLPASKKIVF